MTTARLRRRLRDDIDCYAGEEYLIRRAGKPALTIRIVEVHVNATCRGPQPKAWYVPLTRSGTRRRKRARWEPATVCAFLTWRDGRWQFPHGERLI